MISLSVNVNKIATLRNSRGGDEPSVLRAVEIAVAAGAPGITVHPRADERHIRAADVIDIADWLKQHSPEIEFNIEGDPRPDLLDRVLAVRPAQCTLVPVAPGEITSQAGWPPTTSRDWLGGIVRRLQAAGTRVSVFVDPAESPIRWAAELAANRIELYTEPFAKAFSRGDRDRRESFATYAAAARLATSLGMGVNAGHDLDLDNLKLFRELPGLQEVSIGHAIVSRALWVGLDRVIKEYLEVLGGK